MAKQPKFALLPGISRKAIDRAGTELRDYWLRDDQEPSDAALEAFRTLILFRETFQVPLNKTVLGLRSMVCSEQPELERTGSGKSRIPVVQRLKRRAQIINKLVRLEGTMLSNMGDIGGCRAVLAGRSEVDGVVRLGIPLKEGEGPVDLREYFRLASVGMYRDSLGFETDPAFKAEFDGARERARPYFILDRR